MRVVIADSISARMAYVRQVTQQIGFQVVALGSDGIWAIAFCKKHRPDLAILDGDLPNMPARKVAAALRRDDSATYVIVGTNRTQEHGHAVNPGDYKSINVQKPFNPAAVKAAVKNLQTGNVLPALDEVIPMADFGTTRVPQLPYRATRGTR